MARRSAARTRPAAVALACAALAVAGAAGAAPTSARAQAGGGGPQLPDPGQRPASAGSDARRILSGNDYRHRGASTSFVDRIIAWIRRHLPHFKAPKPTSGGHSSPVWGVIGVIVLVLLLVALVWGLLHIRAGRRTREKDTEDDEGTGDIEITPLRSTDEWGAEANRLEGLGQWREALRARYRQVIGLLIDRHLLGDLPGRTPGEHRVELAEGAPGASGPFDEATRLFEASWFGHEPTEAADLARFRQLADEVSERTASVLVRAGGGDDSHDHEEADDR